MADPLIELARDERCGQRRVDIAGDEHNIWCQLDEHRLEALHHTRGLNGLSARTNVERVIRSADSELLEEDTSHRVVVVLAGVHEHVLELRPHLEPCGDRRNLHVIRARADDGDDPAGAEHRWDCIHQVDYVPVAARCARQDRSRSACAARYAEVSGGRAQASRIRARRDSRRRTRAVADPATRGCPTRPRPRGSQAASARGRRGTSTRTRPIRAGLTR
jgi:hypothetical protein